MLFWLKVENNTRHRHGSGALLLNPPLDNEDQQEHHLVDMDPQTAAIIQTLHDNQQAQQQQNHDLMQQIIGLQTQMLTQASQAQRGGHTSMVDTRGIGKPGSFKGERLNSPSGWLN